jgi:hypothetical protein
LVLKKHNLPVFWFSKIFIYKYLEVHLCDDLAPALIHHHYY